MNNDNAAVASEPEQPRASLGGARSLVWAPALEATDAIKWAALRFRPLFNASGRARSGIAERLSAPAALRAAEHALATVPAYRSFVSQSNWRDRPWRSAAERIALLPETDKASYIAPFSTDDRCVGGALPTSDVEIDESSGSSGTPYSWVRSREELHEVHLTLSLLARHLMGRRLVTLNAFSMGAWATGTNVSKALARNGIIKSTGPDTGKILSAMELLGPRHTYAITGYPPFLRELLDAGDAQGFDWSRYRMYGVVGGEAMSELLRDRLERRFQAVFSAYGASDLDIGVAGEFPLSVWIRKRAGENPALAAALFGDARRLPMVFQYNPLDYYVESNEAGELVVTVNRLCMLSPRIRYNIHDEGGTVGFDRAIAICRDFGLDPMPETAAASGHRPFRLPFLFVRGRSDSTVSYMGANIYPEDVEQGLYGAGAPADTDRLLGFALELVEQPDATLRPCVHVEIDGPTDDHELAARLAGRVRDKLLANSRDFKAAVEEDPRTGDVIVRLHRPGEGPFAEDSSRIKRRYVITKPSA